MQVIGNGPFGKDTCKRVPRLGPFSKGSSNLDLNSAGTLFQGIDVLVQVGQSIEQRELNGLWPALLDTTFHVAN